MNTLDYLLLGIVLISAVLGLMRGLIKEVLSLCAYVAAFAGALWWGPRMSGWLPDLLENPLLRMGAAYLIVFLVVLLTIGLLNMALGAMLDRTGLASADHGLGILFGLLRGVIIVLALVVLAGYTELPQEPWWVESRFSGPSVRLVQTLKQWLPASVVAWLPY
ncbi:MAG: CvpA family protein [Castellaniella sp.]